MEDKGYDEDLFCFSCGYNLRGLSGDTCTCPECGTDNALADLRIPAKIIATRLRKMETLPTVCVAGMLGVAAGLTITVTGGMPCGVVLLVPSPFVWAVAAYRFGVACDFKRGWVAVLTWYHLPAAILVGMWVSFAIAAPYVEDSVFLIVITVCGVFGVWAAVGQKDRASGPDRFSGAYGYAKRRMDAFCREFAVQEAKGETSHVIGDER